MLSDRTVIIVVSLAFVFAVGSLIAPAWLLQIGMLALSRGIVALGLVSLIRCGLISFGQALFFAIGGYTVGLLSIKLGINDVAVRVVAAAASGGLVAWSVGWLLRRYRAIFFAMLTLAFSMIFYGLLIKSEQLGSSDGFRTAGSSLFGVRAAATVERHLLFVFCILIAAVSLIGLHRYWQSTSGRFLTALRDNEIRLEYLGVSAARLVQQNFAIAGALGGVGGALSAMAIGHVDPTMAFWTTSGELLFAAILGGTGSVLAPFVGSFAFEALHSLAQHFAPGAWRIILGSALLVIILFLPHGLWSLRRTLRPSA